MNEWLKERKKGVRDEYFPLKAKSVHAPKP
jgi:hypothetical protein